MLRIRVFYMRCIKHFENTRQIFLCNSISSVHNRKHRAICILIMNYSNAYLVARRCMLYCIIKQIDQYLFYQFCIHWHKEKFIWYSY